MTEKYNEYGTKPPFKAFKAFDRNLRCREMQYKEGETYELDGELYLCKHGLHFCKDLVLTLEYYSVKKCITENKYAEVVVLGDTIYEAPTKHKGVTNKLKILRVLSNKEVRKIVKNQNSENRNFGDRNSGSWNPGSCNSGSWNPGDRNSGDWNACDYETGFFNTCPAETIRVFNKPCTADKWESANKPKFIYFDLDPKLGYKGSFQKAWNEATDKDKELLFKLPNFDPDVFEEISGVHTHDLYKQFLEK